MAFFFNGGNIPPLRLFTICHWVNFCHKIPSLKIKNNLGSWKKKIQQIQYNKSIKPERYEKLTQHTFCECWPTSRRCCAVMVSDSILKCIIRFSCLSINQPVLYYMDNEAICNAFCYIEVSLLWHGNLTVDVIQLVLKIEFGSRYAIETSTLFSKCP